MSQINTNGIDVNYPIPGQNNSSQGFRDNFAQIRTNLNTAGTEITDLQTKVVVKAALDNTTIDNNMANTLISNAAVRGFRSTTYNLGNAISGTLLVDTSLADVQYGAVTGNTTLQFGGWAPTNTESSITLRLSISNASAVISLPSAAISSNNNFGVTLLENYTQIGNVATFTAPANASILEFNITTLDCGVSLSVSPTNRPFQSRQIVTREIPPTGVQGDTNGTVAVGPSVNQLVITGANTDPYLTTSGNTTQLYPDLPVVFTGTSLAGNLVVGTTYYVRNVVSSTTFTVSSSIGGANVAIGANASGTTMLANPASYLYICTDTFDANVTSTYDVVNAYVTTNRVTVEPTTGLVVNAPIVFNGNAATLDTANTNIQPNVVYYVKSIIDVSSPSGNITISRTRNNGIAGTVHTITSNSDPMTATLSSYVGSDIWKRVNLNSW